MLLSYQSIFQIIQKFTLTILPCNVQFFFVFFSILFYLFCLLNVNITKFTSPLYVSFHSAEQSELHLQSDSEFEQFQNTVLLS